MIVVVADAAYASKANMQLICQRGYGFVIAFAQTWCLANGQSLKDLGTHLPKKFWLFRKFCGSQSSALMKDTVAKVLKGAEAEGPALAPRDLGVRAVDETVGEPLGKGGEDLLLPATYGLHTLQQGLVARLLDRCAPC